MCWMLPDREYGLVAHPHYDTQTIQRLEKLQSHVWGLEVQGSHLAFTYWLSIHMELALCCAHFSPSRWPLLVWIDLPLLLASLFARASKRAYPVPLMRPVFPPPAHGFQQRNLQTHELIDNELKHACITLSTLSKCHYAIIKVMETKRIALWLSA